MKTLCAFLLLVSLCATTVPAQSVTTLARDASIGDGLFVDTDGTIYSGGGGLVGKTSVGAILPDGTLGKLPASFAGSIDVDRNGNDLLVTTYDDNGLAVYDMRTKKARTVLSGLDGPAGIAVADGRIFISEFGAPPAYAGHTVTVLDASSYAVVDSVVDARLTRPQGIVSVGNGRLMISNSQGGRIFVYNVKTGMLSDFAMFGMNTVNMAYHDGLLFTANNRTHRLMMMDMEGRFMSFAGDGAPESRDGTIANAGFMNPLGLAFSPDGQYLYVAQSQDGALRRIEMPNMPRSLRSFHEEAGISVDAERLHFPGGVDDAAFFSMGEESVQITKIPIAEDGTIDRSVIPYDDWSVSFLVNGKVYGYRNPSARLDMVVSLKLD